MKSLLKISTHHPQKLRSEIMTKTSPLNRALIIWKNTSPEKAASLLKSFVTTPLLCTKNAQNTHSAKESSLQIQNLNLVLTKTETW